LLQNSGNHADWIVGLNAARLFTTTYNAKLSVGRVQTPTLVIGEFFVGISIEKLN